MGRDRALSLSVLALAVAVALHGLAPALAQDVAPAAAPAAPAPKPACKNLHVGTAKEVAAAMEDLAALGHHHYVVVGTGILCGYP